MMCECELHLEDEDCPDKAYFKVEHPGVKTTYSCVKCLGAVCQTLLAGVEAPLTVTEVY